MLSLCYIELIEKVKIHEEKKTIDDYVLNKVLNKIKEIIGIEKSDETKVLVSTDDKLSDNITFKMLCC